MSQHINKFLDLVTAAELKGQKDLYFSIRDAKNLQNDIMRLLMALEDARNQQSKNTADTLTISLDGGGFKDP